MALFCGRLIGAAPVRSPASKLSQVVEQSLKFLAQTGCERLQGRTRRTHLNAAQSRRLAANRQPMGLSVILKQRPIFKLNQRQKLIPAASGALQVSLRTDGVEQLARERRGHHGQSPDVAIRPGRQSLESHQVDAYKHGELPSA